MTRHSDRPSGPVRDYRTDENRALRSRVAPLALAFAIAALLPAAGHAMAQATATNPSGTPAGPETPDTVPAGGRRTRLPLGAYRCFRNVPD